MMKNHTRHIRTMRLSFAFLLASALAVPLASGQDKPAGKTDSKQSASSKDGKKYVERKTPFGSVKVEQEQEVKKAEPPPPKIHAYEEGDNVRFERKSPFGFSRWVRKKSELDDMERAVWERDCRKPAEAKPAEK